MHYDIYFDPAQAKWRIRMVYPMLVFFSTTREVSAGADPEAIPAVFPTFEAAEEYTKTIGLDRAYTRRYPKKTVGFSEVLNGAQNYTYQTGGSGTNRS